MTIMTRYLVNAKSGYAVKVTMQKSIRHSPTAAPTVCHEV